MARKKNYISRPLLLACVLLINLCLISCTTECKDPDTTRPSKAQKIDNQVNASLVEIHSEQKEQESNKPTVEVKQQAKEKQEMDMDIEWQQFSDIIPGIDIEISEERLPVINQRPTIFIDIVESNFPATTNQKTIVSQDEMNEIDKDEIARLYQAIQDKNMQGIEESLKLTTKIAFLEIYNQPLLNLIIESIKQVNVLIQYQLEFYFGTDYNFKNIEFNTLKYLALLAYKKSINQQIQRIVNLMIDHKADLTIVKDENGANLLHIASQENNVEIVKLLLDKKIFNVNVRNKINDTALHIAAAKGAPEMISALINKKAAINLSNVIGYTPLHLAAQHGHTSAMEFLLTNKANVNAESDEGFTPLHLATQHRHTHAIECLLTNKANVNVKNNQGFTPLHLAVQSGDICAVELLLDNCADANVQSIKGFTPLHLVAQAVDFKEKKIVHLINCLIDKNADINVKDSKKRTPIRYAIKKGCVETLKYLFKKGAKINISKALEDAAKYSDEEIFGLLSEWEGGIPSI